MKELKKLSLISQMLIHSLSIVPIDIRRINKTWVFKTQVSMYVCLKVGILFESLQISRNEDLWITKEGSAALRFFWEIDRTYWYIILRFVGTYKNVKELWGKAQSNAWYIMNCHCHLRKQTFRDGSLSSINFLWNNLLCAIIRCYIIITL